MNLLQFTQKGIYCKKADVFIDPLKPVNRALITHGHSDHARKGHQHYLCTKSSVPILKLRLGRKINIQGINYGQSVSINGVKFSFHPAGHIIGSAQIRVEYKGEKWVVSGDYKIEDDGISEPYEPVKCHHFVTETTFGLPIYNWIPQKRVFDQIHQWWKSNKEQGLVSILTAYSLGKAQRIVHNLDSDYGNIFVHDSIGKMNKVLRDDGSKLEHTKILGPDLSAKEIEGSMIITPSLNLGNYGLGEDHKYSIGAASGWMAVRRMKKNRAINQGFVLSDHCDWDGLNKAIENTEAQNIYPVHGYTEVFHKWLLSKGYNSVTINSKRENRNVVDPNSEQ